MALSGTRLGDAIMDALVAGGGAVEDATARANWRTIGTKIVDEFKNNGQVATVIAGGSTANGVTVGGASVAVTGTTTGAAGSAIS